MILLPAQFHKCTSKITIITTYYIIITTYYIIIITYYIIITAILNFAK